MWLSRTATFVAFRNRSTIGIWSQISVDRRRDTISRDCCRR